jgi:hypothetical protein
MKYHFLQHKLELQIKKELHELGFTGVLDSSPNIIGQKFLRIKTRGTEALSWLSNQSEICHF